MSTEFRTDTGAWVFTRWGRGDGVGYDFGSRRRFHAVTLTLIHVDGAALMLGSDGSTKTADQLLQEIVTGVGTIGYGRHVKVTPTFGEFVGTVALGDGELFDRTGWLESE